MHFAAYAGAKRSCFPAGAGTWKQRFVDAGLRVMDTPSLFVLRKRRS